MLLKIYSENPNPKDVRLVADALSRGELVILPTDSVYAIVCNINHHKAINRLAQLKGLNTKKANFSFLFSDLRQVSEYTRPISNSVFKVMKKNLPGPFTFILQANNELPSVFKTKKKTIGVRIPDNSIVKAVIEELGHPIISTSVRDDDKILEYTTDPELIYDDLKNDVEIIVDGGFGHNVASTVVDCTGNEIEIVREGLKALEF